MVSKLEQCLAAYGRNPDAYGGSAMSDKGQSKLPGMVSFLDSVTGGRYSQPGICAWCGDKVNVHEMRNAKSQSEYRISGMCQKCQDDTFGVD